jgi:dipeptidyl aminopeptidase/acylaminoacyl peptidase
VNRFAPILLAAGLLLTGPIASADTSIEDFVKHAAYGSVQLSPDGQRLAVTIPVDDSTIIAVLDIADPEKIKPTARLALPKGEAVNGLFWANNERLVFRPARQFGSLLAPRSAGQIFAVDADGSRTKQIYGTKQGSYVARFARIIDHLDDQPNHILVAGYTHDREYPVAEVVNINGGPTRVQTHSPLRRGDLVADSTGQARFANGMTDDFKQSFAYRPQGEEDWQVFDNPFPGDISPVAFDTDDKHVIVNSRGPGALGLFRLDPLSGTFEALVTHDVAEVNRVLYDPTTDEVFGAEFLPDYPQLQFIDAEHPGAVLQKQLASAFPGYQLRITSASDDGSRLVIAAFTDRQPAVFYLFDKETNSVRPLVQRRPWINAKQMSAREAFWITARDGVKLQGYLTHPQDNDGDLAPLVVVVHGGPHGPRDRWGYDRESQLLASRGYRVLQLNYRGSGGRGQAFEESGYGKWGVEMQDDVTDATLWAIQEGLAQRGQICIYGASYGGYAVLSGITREPDLYDCAFAFVGVYDLALMKKRGNVPDLIVWGSAYLDAALGKEKEDLYARSPVNFVSKIKTPLYLVHGQLDRQAHVDNYYQLCKALDKQSIPYQKLLVKGEAHGFYAEENNVKLYNEMLNFFDQHIGNQARTANR